MKRQATSLADDARNRRKGLLRTMSSEPEWTAASGTQSSCEYATKSSIPWASNTGAIVWGDRGQSPVELMHHNPWIPVLYPVPVVQLASYVRAAMSSRDSENPHSLPSEYTLYLYSVSLSLLSSTTETERRRQNAPPRWKILQAQPRRYVPIPIIHIHYPY